MKVLHLLMIGALMATVLLMTSCVSQARYHHDMKRFYKDGFRMGRVVGTDETLHVLETQGCQPKTSMSVDNLMNPDPPEVKR